MYLVSLSLQPSRLLTSQREAWLVKRAVKSAMGGGCSLEHARQWLGLQWPALSLERHAYQSLLSETRGAQVQQRSTACC